MSTTHQIVNGLFLLKHRSIVHRLRTSQISINMCTAEIGIKVFTFQVSYIGNETGMLSNCCIVPSDFLRLIKRFIMSWLFNKKVKRSRKNKQIPHDKLLFLTRTLKIFKHIEQKCFVTVLVPISFPTNEVKNLLQHHFATPLSL